MPFVDQKVFGSYQAMDSQELNRACELAFRVAREGVEQDPPIDPPASMRMFLYVRQYPQRALTVARQVLSEDEAFRARVAAEATEENVGGVAFAWLNGNGEIASDSEAVSDADTLTEATASADSVDSDDTAVDHDGPVTKESIRSEMDELKSLVGQLSDERDAVGSEVQGLAGRLEESEGSAGLSSALASATTTAGSTSSSLSTQIRGLHADLKHARSERDHAQEAKELAILDHAELAEELESLRTLAGSARVQLTDLESKVDAVATEKAQLESEKNQLAAERETLSSDKDSLSAEVEEAATKLAASEEKLTLAATNLEELTTELETARSSAGVSVGELQAAVSARAAMESHVDALGGAQAKAQAEMERVNSALSDKTASDAEKIETLKVALVSVTAERDALQAKLESVRATVNSLQGEMAKLDTNMTDAESVANVLNERMEELQSSVDAMPSDSEIVGDLTQFEAPENPEFAEHVAPSFAAPVVTEPESIDDVADEVAETVSSFDDDQLEEDVNDVADEAPAGTDVVESADDSDEDDGDLAEAEILETEDSVVEAEEPVLVELEVEDNAELVPDEMINQVDADDFMHNLEEVDADSTVVSPLVMSDTADDVDVADALAIYEPPTELDSSDPDVTELDDEVEAAAVGESSETELPEIEDIDEVHALVADTVASFEPNETDYLPGSDVSAEAAADAGASADRGGLTSLFSTSTTTDFADAELGASDFEIDDSESDGGTERGLLATAGIGLAGATAWMPGRDEVAPEQLADPASEGSALGRGPISVPGELATDSLATARHIVNTENAVLLVDGDPVAAMGWPSVDRVEQRRNLVHYLSVMAGTSGAAPDVLLDRDFGVDRLPDSRSVRVRVTNEEGSVLAQIVSLIDTYPTEWPVVVITDNMDLAAEAAMKGATLLDNGQLLDLFIAP